MKKDIQIGKKVIGINKPTYFVADVAANHDGDIERAKDLIYMCAEAGADAAKFQHFTAESIVSDYGFKSLGSQQSHQSRWKESVFDTYKTASINNDWTPILKETCDKAGIVFLTSPYSMQLVDSVDPYVHAYKIGSGDITWHEIISYMATKQKPLMLASGASNISEVKMAMGVLLAKSSDVILMQCNTNYTGCNSNFSFINLNVLKEYKQLYPDVILGLSDHTKGHTTVLGAVTLGARVIEKHFTDDISRQGPDHSFSMDAKAWREMVSDTRELESALGSRTKKVEGNEAETVVLQRRSIRARYNLDAGDLVTRDMFEVLRPCPSGALEPYHLNDILGRKLANSITEGDSVFWQDLM